MYDKPSIWRSVFLICCCDFIAFTRIQFGAMAWLDLFMSYIVKNLLLMQFPYSLPHLYMTWAAGAMIMLHGFETYFSPPIPKRYPGHMPVPYVNEFLLSVAVGFAIWWYPVEIVEFKPVTALLGYPNPFAELGGMFLGVVASFLEDVAETQLVTALAVLIPASMLLYDVCERNEAPGGMPERDQGAMSFPDAR